jgi:hypothetical protein
VISEAAPRTTAVLDVEVGLESSITPGTRVGHWVGLLAGPLTVLALGLSMLGYRRRRSPGVRDRALEPREPSDRDLTRVGR